MDFREDRRETENGFGSFVYQVVIANSGQFRQAIANKKLPWFNCPWLSRSLHPSAFEGDRLGPNAGKWGLATGCRQSDQFVSQWARRQHHGSTRHWPLSPSQSRSETSAAVYPQEQRQIAQAGAFNSSAATRVITVYVPVPMSCIDDSTEIGPFRPITIRVVPGQRQWV